MRPLSLQCLFFSPPSLTTLVAPLCCLHCRNWHLTNRSLNKYIYICIYKQHGFAVSVRKRPASSSAALQLRSRVSQFCSDSLEFERSKSPTARKRKVAGPRFSRNVHSSLKVRPSVSSFLPLPCVRLQGWTSSPARAAAACCRPRSSLSRAASGLRAPPPTATCTTERHNSTTGEILQMTALHLAGVSARHRFQTRPSSS